MNNKLKAELTKMSEVDFCHFKFAYQTASWVRQVMKIHNISEAVMAKRLGLTKAKFRQFKNMSYTYRISDWANLQAFEMELEIELAHKKVEGRIQFPDYKYTESIKQPEKL